MSFRAAGNATAPTMGLRDPRFYQPLDAFLSYRKAPGGSEPQVAGLQGRRRGKRGGRRGCGCRAGRRGCGCRAGRPPTHGPARQRAPPLIPAAWQGRPVGPLGASPRCRAHFKKILPQKGLGGWILAPTAALVRDLPPCKGHLPQDPLAGRPYWVAMARTTPSGRRGTRPSENGTKVSGWWDKSVRPMGHCISKKAPGTQTGAGSRFFPWCPR